MPIRTRCARAEAARCSTRCATCRASRCAPSTTSIPISTIDVEAEQRALAASRLVVWQHPIYWYSVPALLKLWFDKVLAYGWAYGEGGTALRGKHCLWVATTGGDRPTGTRPRGMHAHPFAGVRAARSSRPRASAACTG